MNEQNTPIEPAPSDAQAAVSSDAKPPKPPFRLAAWLFDFVEAFTTAAVVVILLFTFATRLTTVFGPSMETTFFEGEKLLVSDLFYAPQPGDILVFHELGDFVEPIIKRVIATEGQTVDMVISEDEWSLYVDGELIDEPYRHVDDSALRTAMHDFPVTVPEGHIFVMGDNRNHSADSRVTYMGNGGFIDERQILGKVILRLTPFDRFGPVA